MQRWLYLEISCVLDHCVPSNLIKFPACRGSWNVQTIYSKINEQAAVKRKTGHIPSPKDENTSYHKVPEQTQAGMELFDYTT